MLHNTVLHQPEVIAYFVGLAAFFTLFFVGSDQKSIDRATALSETLFMLGIVGCKLFGVAAMLLVVAYCYDGNGWFMLASFAAIIGGLFFAREIGVVSIRLRSIWRTKSNQSFNLM